MFLEQKAGEVAGRLDSKTAQLELGTIILMIKLVIQTYECFKTHPFSALAGVKNPTFLQKLKLRALVIRHYGLWNSQAMVNALLTTAQFLSYTELVGMVNEVQGE